jgi:hypothetical protein
MNSESIEKVTNQAIEKLVEALNAGHSKAATRYLAAIAKFRAYSFLNVLPILKRCPNAGCVVITRPVFQVEPPHSICTCPSTNAPAGLFTSTG